MWTEEICQNITNELTKQLDDRSFFGAKKYYTDIHKNTETKVNRPKDSNITKNDFSDIDSAVKGMAFSNKIHKKIRIRHKLTQTKLPKIKLTILKLQLKKHSKNKNLPFSKISKSFSQNLRKRNAQKHAKNRKKGKISQQK